MSDKRIKEYTEAGIPFRLVDASRQWDVTLIRMLYALASNQDVKLKGQTQSC